MPAKISIIGLDILLILVEAYSAIYIPENNPIGTATNIAINAINEVPAIKGMKPKASFNSSYSAAVIDEASLTKALWGLQFVPNR